MLRSGRACDATSPASMSSCRHGGHRPSPDGVRLDLDLVEERSFASGDGLRRVPDPVRTYPRRMPRTPPGHGLNSAVERVLAPTGLVLVGAGLSVAMDASARRAAGGSPTTWVALGTAGLVLVGSGLSVFGDAVRRRAQAG